MEKDLTQANNELLTSFVVLSVKCVEVQLCVLSIAIAVEDVFKRKLDTLVAQPVTEVR